MYYSQQGKIHRISCPLCFPKCGRPKTMSSSMIMPDCSSALLSYPIKFSCLSVDEIFSNYQEISNTTRDVTCSCLKNVKLQDFTEQYIPTECQYFKSTCTHKPLCADQFMIQFLPQNLSVTMYYRVDEGSMAAATLNALPGVKLPVITHTLHPFFDKDCQYYLLLHTTQKLFFGQFLHQQ